MDKPETVFIGQQIVYYGNPMSKTIEGLPKERMIETPVMEETQMGMSLGMAMGKVKTAAPSKDGIAEKGKTKGKMIGMKMGGKAC